MKFVLILHVCSFITMQCPVSKIAPYEYVNWHHCALNGYRLAAEAMEKLPKNRINKEKLAIKFECKEVAVPL